MKLGLGLGLNRRRVGGGGGGGGDTIPVITGVPTISGTATVGSTLTASPASVAGSPTPTRTWQWARDGVDIGGATSITYTLVVADYGVTITVRQIETNVAGADDATSAGTVIAWEPAAIFQSSEAGFWAPVTTSRLWQDTARTTPVTAPGDPVASWELTTASGVVYAVQATGGSRPLYQEDTGVGYLDFDGTDDRLTISSVNFSGTAIVSVFAGIQIDITHNGCVLSHGAAAATGGFYVYCRGVNGATQQNVLGYAVGGTNEIWEDNASASVPRKVVSASIHDRTQAAAIDEVTIRIDGSVAGKIQNPGALTPKTGNYDSLNFDIGRFSTGTLPFNGRVYGLIVRGTDTTGTDLTDAEAWMDALVNP